MTATTLTTDDRAARSRKWMAVTWVVGALAIAAILGAIAQRDDEIRDAGYVSVATLTVGALVAVVLFVVNGRLAKGGPPGHMTGPAGVALVASVTLVALTIGLGALLGRPLHLFGAMSLVVASGLLAALALISWATWHVTRLHN